MTPSCMSLDTDRTPDGLAHGDARLPSGDGREDRRLRSNCAEPEKAQPEQRVSTTLSSTVGPTSEQTEAAPTIKACGIAATSYLPRING
jgi:hypothetical protein